MHEQEFSGSNIILDLLPADEFETIRGMLAKTALSQHQLLYAGGALEDLEYVYFPTTAVTSMLNVMHNGDTVESGTVGREGIVGVQAAISSSRLLERWICQVPGSAWRMRTGDFTRALSSSTALEKYSGRYIHSFLSSLAQSVACNRLHTISERCARWLLLTHDRAARPVFPLTHEFLALMLGVRRSGVTIAASTLQLAGCIRYTRGNITIVDRRKLEQQSCECYAVCTDEYQRIFELPIRVDGVAFDD